MKDDKIIPVLDYLEEERKKIWAKIVFLEEEYGKRTTDYEREAKESSKKTSEYKNRSEDAKNKSLAYLEEAQKALDNINEIYNTITKTQEETNNNNAKSAVTNNLLQENYNEFENKKLQIETDIAELEQHFKGIDTYTTQIKRLNEIFNEGEELSSKLEVLFKSIMNQKKEFDNIYVEIQGYTEVDKVTKEETKVPGKKDELEKTYDNLKKDLVEVYRKLNEFENNSILNLTKIEKSSKDKFDMTFLKWDEEFNYYANRIKALLPDALTTGLSYAYSEKKVAEIKEYEMLNKTFIKAIWGLIGISLIPFAVATYNLTFIKGTSLEEVILKIPKIILSIVPLYIPVLWVAYSANRKMNLSKRLSEEYSHKEVLSKTFEGLSTQIQNIEDKKISTDLRIKLLYNILEVSSENPGKLISNYNKSDHPLMDALDKSVKLAGAVEKLAKIPGFSKLTSSIQKKAEAILSDEDKKATAGLKAIEEEDDDEKE